MSHTPPVDSQGAAIEKEIQRLMDAYWGVSGHNRDEKRPIYSEAILAILAQEVNKARIDELEHILDIGEGVSLNFDPEINPITIEERIKDLERLG